MCSRQGAKNPGVLRCPVIDLHNIIESCLEEGELTEDHWEREIWTPNRHQRKRKLVILSESISVAQKPLKSIKNETNPLTRTVLYLH